MESARKSIQRSPFIRPILLEFVEQSVDVDEDFAAGNYGLLKTLLGEDFDRGLVEVHFSHSCPDYGPVYDELFQCNLRFDQAETSIRYPATWLDQPPV